MCRWTVILLGILFLFPGTAAAQDIAVEAPFAGSYSVADLGPPPGVPPRFGGLTLKAGTTDRLLIGGEANQATGALYEIGVTRDASGHIDGFTGTATRYADAANNDGGVAYGPGGVLFLARWPLNELGQARPGSTTTDKVIGLTPTVASSLAALQFVPPGQPGAGSLKLSSYGGGQWYDAELAPDGTGLYDIASVRAIPSSTLSGGPEGFVYVPSGSPRFDAPSLLVSEYAADQIATYRVNGDGDPIVDSRRTFLTGLDGAEGAFLDPVTGDYLFSTFGSTGRVIVIRGFRRPPPDLPAPEAGKTVNALEAGGTVRIKLPGRNRYVLLGPGQQIPVGTTIDTTKGRVTIVAAGEQQATFYDGIFKLSQKRGSRPLTTLTLVERLRCRGRASAAAKAKRKRRLWGDGTGRFQTKGRHSAATVVGTTWLVEDRCDSTLTKVKQGRVSVRDFAKRRTIIVTAGKQYVAKAKQR